MSKNGSYPRWSYNNIWFDLVEGIVSAESTHTIDSHIDIYSSDEGELRRTIFQNGYGFLLDENQFFVD